MSDSLSSAEDAKAFVSGITDEISGSFTVYGLRTVFDGGDAEIAEAQAKALADASFSNYMFVDAPPQPEPDSTDTDGIGGESEPTTALPKTAEISPQTRTNRPTVSLFHSEVSYMNTEMEAFNHSLSMLGGDKDAFIITDGDLNAIYISPAAYRPESCIIGTCITDYIGETDAFRLEEFTKRRERYDSISSIELPSVKIADFNFAYAVRRTVFGVPCIQIYLFPSKRDFLLSDEKHEIYTRRGIGHIRAYFGYPAGEKGA